MYCSLHIQSLISVFVCHMLCTVPYTYSVGPLISVFVCHMLCTVPYTYSVGPLISVFVCHIEDCNYYTKELLHNYCHVEAAAICLLLLQWPCMPLLQYNVILTTMIADKVCTCNNPYAILIMYLVSHWQIQ